MFREISPKSIAIKNNYFAGSISMRGFAGACNVADAQNGFMVHVWK